MFKHPKNGKKVAENGRKCWLKVKNEFQITHVNPLESSKKAIDKLNDYWSVSGLFLDFLTIQKVGDFGQNLTIKVKTNIEFCL